jgi:hypothetical protein
LREISDSRFCWLQASQDNHLLIFWEERLSNQSQVKASHGFGTLTRTKRAVVSKGVGGGCSRRQIRALSRSSSCRSAAGWRVDALCATSPSSAFSAKPPLIITDMHEAPRCAGLPPETAVGAHLRKLAALQAESHKGHVRGALPPL